jgi:hypothetical protein
MWCSRRILSMCDWFYRTIALLKHLGLKSSPCDDHPCIWGSVAEGKEAQHFPAEFGETPNTQLNLTTSFWSLQQFRLQFNVLYPQMYI